MKIVEYIKRKEFYDLKLKEIVNYIIDCDTTIENIFCGYCHKKYNIKHFINHNCLIK